MRKKGEGNLNLTFKIYMQLTIDVGKVVVWGGRQN
jgi:hypothetical protein